MPGILIETGFITNPDEEKYLMSEEGQDFIASAIFRAFRDYKKIIESRSSFAMAPGSGKPAVTQIQVIQLVQIRPLKCRQEDHPDAGSEDYALWWNLRFRLRLHPNRFHPDAHIFKGLTGVSEYHVGRYL